MWECPKCKRVFKNTNQDHFCGEPPNSIDAYISDQPENLQIRLHELRKALRETLPNAEEKISWRMPTYKGKTNIIHFAAFKNHVGIYPGDQAVLHFEEKLKDYKSSKGAIQFPHDKPLPLDLIVEIAKWCYETGSHHS